MRETLSAVGGPAGGDGLAPLVAAAADLLAAGIDLRAVVLVEGASDRLALAATAEHRGQDLHAEGTAIVAMGGATNIRRFLEVFGPRGLDVRLAGLCDDREVGDVLRGLQHAGLGADLTRPQLASLGFFVCVPDLEAELIAALGVAAVERVVAAEGELGPLRTFQQQPAQRDRAPEAQLRRFLGTRSGRKIRYGRLLVEALDRHSVPAPLHGVLDHVAQG